MKRFVSLTVAVLMLCAVFFVQTSAAAIPTLSVSMKKYDIVNKTYADADSASAGDLMVAEISVKNPIASISALRLSLKYDGDSFEFADGSAVFGLAAGSPTVSSKNNSSPASLTFYWLQESPQNPVIAQNFEGMLVRVFFACKGSSDKSCDFTLDVLEGFDRNYKKIKFASNSASASVAVKQQQLSAEDIAAFSKLLNIKYPDSKGDIEEADKIFAKYNASQQSAFKNNYSDLFSAYKNAWTEYYRLANEASLAQIKAEIEKFNRENSDILQNLNNLTAEDVNEDNYEDILNLKKSYDSLSDQAKVRIDSSVKQKITSLSEAAERVQILIEDRQIAEEAFSDFVKLYENIWGLNDETVKKSAAEEDFIQMITDALSDYKNLSLDLLSDATKATAAGYEKQLNRYFEIIKEYLEQSGKDSKVLEEVLAFKTKWNAALKLNALTVGIGDESLVKYCLADFDSLSKEAKAQLSSQENNLKQMLTLIASLKNVKDTSGGTTVVPQGNTSSQTQSPQKIIEVKENIVEKIKNNTFVRDIPMIVKIMVILALIGVLSTAVPIVCYLVYIKRKEGVSQDEKII